MIYEEHDLEIEEQEELGLIPHHSEPHISATALEWIETAAYFQWLNDGCPDGQHDEHWHRAYLLYKEIHRELRL